MMRFVPVKSEEQQAMLMAHKTRDLLIKQRTMGVNALRGHLAEFGIIAAKGIGHVEELIEKAADAGLPEMARAALSVLVGQLAALDGAIAVYSDGGYELHTSAATVDMQAATITGNRVVTGQGPSGTFRADRFRCRRRVALGRRLRPLG